MIRTDYRTGHQFYNDKYVSSTTSACDPRSTKVAFFNNPDFNVNFSGRHR